MKKTLRHILFATLIATMPLFISCKDDEGGQDPQPTDDVIEFETPRYMDSDGENLYITCYYPTAVVRFNTSTRKVTGICNLGKFHPEGIAAVGGKLYIASSNISDENYNYSYDNKLYVVDIASFTLVDSVIVGVNPNKVKKLDNNHIAFNTLGDYYNDFGGMYIMNTDNKEITKLSTDLYNFDTYNGDIYGYTSPYGTLGFYKISGSSLTSSTLDINLSGTDNPYGINVNPYNGDIIIVTDGNYVASGDCYVFTNNGQTRFSALPLSNLPSKAVAIDNNNLLVLNEGGWGANNAEVSLVDVSESSANVDFFSFNNGRGLGDVAQDMIIVGNKAYISVSFSNSIEIMDIATGISTRYGTLK